jgi:hypothetical protein
VYYPLIVTKYHYLDVIKGARTVSSGAFFVPPYLYLYDQNKLKYIYKKKTIKKKNISSGILTFPEHVEKWRNGNTHSDINQNLLDIMYKEVYE